MVLHGSFLFLLGMTGRRLQNCENSIDSSADWGYNGIICKYRNKRPEGGFTMRMSRKILSLVMACVMLFTLIPTGAVASATETAELPHDHEHTHETQPVTESVPETEPQTEPVTEPAAEPEPATEPEEQKAPEKQPGVVPETLPETDHIVKLNPVYEGILTIDDLVFPEGEFEPSELDPQDESSYQSVSEAGVFLRGKMKARTGNVTLRVRTSSSDRWGVLDQVFAAALAHTGVPDEGDSLKWQYGGYEASVSTSSSGGSYLYTYTLRVPYYTTASQEQQLNTAVDNLLAQLNLDGKSDYEKVCAVYDYITRNIEYDYVHLNNPDYTLQFTAYAALVSKTAVCQGLSVLLYRLCLELGIDSRVITSIPQECHAWSIVGLDGWFYLCDSTWDLGMWPNYSWFLRGSNHFPEHTAAYDDEYRTAEFTSRFPINPNNYVPGSTPGPGPEDPDVPENPDLRMEGWCGDNVYYTLDYDGVLTLTGTGSTYDYPDGYPSPWEDIASVLRKIEVGEGITRLGDFLFFYADYVTEVTLPSTLEELGDGVFEYCRYLPEVQLPSGLRRIDNAVFWCCEQLTEITIPASVNYIGDCAFYWCSGLEEITFRGSAPTFDGADIFWDVTATAYYPASESSWRSVINNDYGGNITWVSYIDTASSVELVSAPNVVSYAAGDSLDLTGLEIRVILGDGSSIIADLDSVTVVSCDMSTVGVQTVVVEAYGHQLSFQVYIHPEVREITLDPSTYPESDHDYSENEDDTQIIYYPGARSITIQFSGDSKTEESWDKIYIYDGKDNLLWELSGDSFGGSAMTISGDTVKIRLTSDSSVNRWGYSFDVITASVLVHPGEEIGGREATCTEDGVRPTVLCEICGMTTGGETIPALGHNWDEGEVIEQPSGASMGIIRYTCLRCGATRDDSFGSILGSGTFGENGGLTWTVWETGLMVISGQDAMDSQMFNQPRADWNDRITTVQVEEGVTSVGHNAFGNLYRLQSVSLPSTIARIGTSAFDGCIALQRLTIPAGVNYIGDCVFLGSGLNEIQFLGGAPETMGSDLFDGQSLTVSYPVTELSWTRENMLPYGAGNILWMPQGQISELVINTLPKQIYYAVGDYFNQEGLGVDAVLPNGDIAQLHSSCLAVEYESMAYMGAKNVTVSLGELSTTFQVYVHVGWEDKTLDSGLYPESNHDYENYLDDIQTIRYPGARSLTLSFSQDTYVEQSYDHIYVMDGNGNVWYEYTGSQAAGQTVTVWDDEVQIRLTSDVSASGYGYSFDLITASTVIHTGEFIDGREPTCTEDGTASCLICDICGQEIGGHVLPALGHDWDTGHFEGSTLVYTCLRCGEKRTEDLNRDTIFSDFEWEVLLLTNRERLANGLQPLTGFLELQQAGDIRAEEIQTLFEHDRPNGTSCFTVLDELGIPRTSAAENIAYGYVNPADVMNGWMNSEGHRNNILRAGVSHLGVGYYSAARRNWVQMFAGYSDESYTSMSLCFPNGNTFPAGTGFDEMGIYAVLDNSIYGKCYLPLMAEFISGYDPQNPGDQEVTVNVLGFSSSFTLTRAGCIHEYLPLVTEPTCTENGYTTFTCVYCGESYVGEEIPARGHEFLDGTCLNCGGEADQNAPQIIVENVQANPGEEVSVTISLKNNPGITSMKLNVSFEEILTLTNVEFNAEIGGQSMAPGTMNSPVILNWFQGHENVTGDWDFVTLTFRVAEDAQPGMQTAIRVAYDPADLFDINENNIRFDVVSGKVTIANHTPGDITGDGVLNNKDLTRLFRYLSGYDVDVNEAALDVTDDGAVNNKDLTRLFRYLSGYDVSIS